MSNQDCSMSEQTEEMGEGMGSEGMMMDEAPPLDDAQRQRVKAARTRHNRALRTLDRHPDFLDRWEALLDDFAE